VKSNLELTESHQIGKVKTIRYLQRHKEHLVRKMVMMTRIYFEILGKIILIYFWIS